MNKHDKVILNKIVDEATLIVMFYHHGKIDRKPFGKYARRYSPCGSAASLYLWAIAGGAIPEMRDHAPGKAVN